MMKKWLHATWYLFVILAMAQIIKTSLQIFLPAWHPKIIYLSFNLVLIITSFFVSWQSYKISDSIVKSVSTTLVLLLVSCIGINILTALIIVKIHLPLLFVETIKQLPIAFQNGLIYAPMVILLSFIACRTQDKKRNIKK